MSLFRWFILLFLIAPEYFGIVALSLMVITLPRILIEESTSSALIRYENPDNQLLSSCFWFNIAVACTICLLFLPVAFLTASYFGEPSVLNIYVCYAIFSVFESTASVHYVLLQRKLKFRILARIEVFSFLVSSIVSIILAVLDFYWQAIVVQSAVTYLFSGLYYFYYADFKVRFSFKVEQIQKIIRFSLYVIGYRLLTYIMTFLDDFLIGKFFGSNTLGLYDRSYQLAHLPMRKVTNRITSVLFPAYSAAQADKKELNRVHLAVIKVSILFYLPVIAGFTVFARPFVKLFLPEQWAVTGTLLPIIAIGAVFRALTNYNVSLFKVYNRTDLLFKKGALSRFAGIIGIASGFSFGLIGICIGYTTGCFIGLLIEWYSIRRFGLRFGKILRQCGLSFLLTGVIILLMFLPIFAVKTISAFAYKVLFFSGLFLSGYYVLYKKFYHKIIKQYKINRN